LVGGGAEVNDAEPAVAHEDVVIEPLALAVRPSMGHELGRRAALLMFGVR